MAYAIDELLAVVRDHPAPWMIKPDAVPGVPDLGPHPLLTVIDARGVPILTDCGVARRSHLESIARFINAVFLRT